VSDPGPEGSRWGGEELLASGIFVISAGEELERDMDGRRGKLDRGVGVVSSGDPGEGPCAVTSGTSMAGGMVLVSIVAGEATVGEKK